MTKLKKKLTIYSFIIFFICLILSYGGAFLIIESFKYIVTSDIFELLQFLKVPISFILFALIFIPSIIIFGIKENKKLKENALKYGKKIDFKLEDIIYYDETDPSGRNIFCIIEDIKTHDLYCVSNTSLNITWADISDNNIKINARVNGLFKQVKIGDTLTGWILVDTIKEEKLLSKKYTYYKDAKSNIFGNILYNLNPKNDITLLNKNYKTCDGWYEFN